MLTDEEFINEYDHNRERYREEQKDRIETIKLLVKQEKEANLEYFSYAQARGWFKIPIQEQDTEALVNAIQTFTGHLIKWDVDTARAIAWRVLEDVNDHDTAKQVRELLNTFELYQQIARELYSLPDAEKP